MPRSFSCGGLGSRTEKVVMPVMRWRRVSEAVFWVVEERTWERSWSSVSCAGGEGCGVGVAEGVEAGAAGAGEVEERGRAARRERSWVVRRVFWRSSDASWDWRAGRSADMAGGGLWGVFTAGVWGFAMFTLLYTPAGGSVPLCGCRGESGLGCRARVLYLHAKQGRCSATASFGIGGLCPRRGGLECFWPGCAAEWVSRVGRARWAYSRVSGGRCGGLQERQRQRQRERQRADQVEIGDSTTHVAIYYLHNTHLPPRKHRISSSPPALSRHLPAHLPIAATGAF